MVEKLYISYNHVHKLCKEAAEQLKKFNPDLMIAIGGGGFIPARILRTFLKEPGSKNIPIQAIGLSLYENLDSNNDESGNKNKNTDDNSGGKTGEPEKAGVEVIRTQWLDFNTLENHAGSLIGKNILIVDEVDDTRTTLHYALSELQKDVDKQAKLLGRVNEPTRFLVFVLHNKDKPKNAQFPAGFLENGNYLAARTVKDIWISYPWEARDIEEQTRLAIEQGNN